MMSTLEPVSRTMLWRAYLTAWSTNARAMLSTELTRRGLAP
jgi:hypothetical protein